MNKQRVIEKRILAQHRIIADRLRADPEKVLSHARKNLVRWAAAYSNQQRPHWMNEWAVLLDKPIVELIAVLTADTENARRLRSSSPFAGIVSPRERWAICRDIKDDA